MATHLHSNEFSIMFPVKNSRHILNGAFYGNLRLHPFSQIVWTKGIYQPNVQNAYQIFLPPTRFWKTEGGIVLDSIAVSPDVLLYILVAVKASFMKFEMCNICKNNIAKMLLVTFLAKEVMFLVSVGLSILATGGYMLGSIGFFVCRSVCLSVRLRATLLKKLWTNCNEILWRGQVCYNEEMMIKFCWLNGSPKMSRPKWAKTNHDSCSMTWSCYK